MTSTSRLGRTTLSPGPSPRSHRVGIEPGRARHCGHVSPGPPAMVTSPLDPLTVTKPIDEAELSARIRAMLRRVEHCC